MIASSLLGLPRHLLPVRLCTPCYFSQHAKHRLNGPKTRNSASSCTSAIPYHAQQFSDSTLPSQVISSQGMVASGSTRTDKPAPTLLGLSRRLLVPRPCIAKGHHCSGMSNYVAAMRHLEKLKENEDSCRDAMKAGQYTVFYDLKALMSTDEASGRIGLAWRNVDEINKILALFGGLSQSDAVLLSSTSLGFPDQPAKFALNIPKGGETSQEVLEKALGAQAVGVRRALFGVGKADVQDLIQAYALLQWHSLQGFCSKCGGVNHKNLAGNRRVCSSCSLVHYPTMNPIVITLVVDGERCLVARQPQFPDGMYSALAGFCDMGETVEAAVRREVAEEVGLEVENITYSGSQHWTLPTSGLMLGCYGNLNSGSDGQLSIDTNELEDARWLTRDEVQDILEFKGQGTIWLPPKRAIAHHLIRGWAFQT